MDCGPPGSSALGHLALEMDPYGGVGCPSRTSHPHTGMSWTIRGAESASARRARGSAGVAVLDNPQHAQVRGGALRRKAPPGAGEEDGSGEAGETRRRDGGPLRGSPHRDPVELRPLARGRRGGQEALALTSRGPAGDGGSGHSTLHRPPPQRRVAAASDVTAHEAEPSS
jgi:hypothetical protein